MKVLEALAAAIAAEGIDHIFAVMGDANQDIIVELCEKHGLKFVHAHHEAAAVGMADGYSRFTGKIGLASTTQGPGYTNATTSLVLARLHRSPVLMLAGHASLRDPYNPQGMVDQDAMAKLTAGATVKVNHANNVDYCLGEAFRQLKARKGPFVLNMPQDIQHSVLPDPNWTYRPMYKAKVLQPPRREDVAEAAKIVAGAKKPTILCGLGAAQGKAEPEVRKLAEYLGAPVATTLYAAGFCSQYPLYLGISGGLGSDLTVDILAESDVMIVVGASLNEWTTHFGKILENGKKIIQVDDREDAFGWFARVAVGLEADAKIAVAALLERLKESGKQAREPDAETVEKLKQRKPPAINYEDGKTVDPRRVASYLEDKLPKRDRILVFDGGHAAMVTSQAMSSPSADNWGLGLDFGAIGQGLSIALGACFARPGKRITHLTADASFMMNVADFHTAVSHNLPLTVVVFNDNAVGQERHDLVHKGFPTKYADIAQPDFEKLAVGMGAKGFRVNRPDDFGEIDKALAVEDGPVIVNVRINGDVELPVSWEIAQHLEMTE
ncbi:acetolactate synthase-1/2/3 large subunit [Mesorhizobium soli]|uniref:thiamine pyrophosphate-binding protein n=1 Tax=Pseudaminobacter soli (ex Li et al. 2025) TaxID=1295366 RepID=UPI002473F6C0|nr:thiamine pyrophosphate-binding protein [Mesorhizobium soli]MDH6233875.1 acetolactate synthase-1/2/3 large subunit [Mesorhizobium soli]